jgi:transcriptional regulator with XRE-family HTH domain
MLATKRNQAPACTTSSLKSLRNRHKKVKLMPESFPELLRKTREGKGLSQSELAHKTGFQPSAISHFESGRRSPSFENLKRLADALSVTIDYLLGREAEPKSAGPVAEQLFRNFEQMSSDDQESLAKFAQLLAEKNKERREGK